MIHAFLPTFRFTMKIIESHVLQARNIVSRSKIDVGRKKRLAWNKNEEVYVEIL